jgi:hypothetical protein
MTTTKTAAKEIRSANSLQAIRDSVAHAEHMARGLPRPEGMSRSARMLFYSVLRHICTTVKEPLRCPEARCRRVKRCVGPSMACQPPLSAQVEQEGMYWLRDLVIKER